MHGNKMIGKIIIFALICLGNIESITSESIVYCGLSNPTIATDCYGYSNNTNSCCFYSYAGNNGCALLNTRYKGATQYGGLVVSCFEEMIKFKIVYVLSFLFVLFNN